jgi:hypothetical protein
MCGPLIRLEGATHQQPCTSIRTTAAQTRQGGGGRVKPVQRRDTRVAMIMRRLLSDLMVL